MSDQPEHFAKASKVIAALQALIEKHGDLPVCVDDADTGWRLALGAEFHKEGPDGLPSRIEIRADYHGLPEGYVEP